MQRFTVSGQLLAENIEHAMLTLAHDLVETVAEGFSESGQVGEVMVIEVQPVPVASDERR